MSARRAAPPSLPFAGWAWLGWLSFVVYGSLLPFDFHARPLDEAIAAFRAIPFLALGIESRADWVANGVLYLPVGLLGMLALAQPNRRDAIAAVLPIVLVVGWGVAVGVEFAQLFFPPRTVSQNDLIAEGLGTVLGAGAAPVLMPWMRRLAQTLREQRSQLGARLLELYAVGFGLLALFPFDLLLNAQEWSAKLGSDLCGWWVAVVTWQRGPVALALLAAEAALAMPLGMLWASRRRAPGSPVAAAAVLGLLLGVAVELAQLTIASGVSQGVSVLTRGLGAGLGAALWQRWKRRDAAGWRQGLQPLLGLATLAYLLALAAVNGLLSHPPKDAAALAAQWDELRLIPFYYHYFTTEAEAVFSLGSVVLMYLPPAVLGWLRAWPPRRTQAVTLVVVALVELAKFTLTGLHPDPTNVLIAWAACATAQGLLGWLDGPAADTQAHPAAADSAVQAEEAGAGGQSTVRPWAAVLPAGLALWTVAALPEHGALAAALLTLAAGLVVWRPILALVLLPAFWPLLDLTPWTGRLYWSEIDAAALLLSAVVLWRAPGAARWRLSAGWWLLAGLLVLGALRQGGPSAWLEPGALVGLYGPLAGWRLLRGLLWAGLLLWMARRLCADAAAATPWLAAGVATGTLGTVATVLWERAAFPGWWDFDSVYRVTGPFSAMHTGGATIEAHLTAGAAALGWLAWRSASAPVRWAALLALLPTTYAVLMTYSRNGHAALAVVALLLTVCVLHQRRGPASARWVAAGALALMAALAWPVLSGGFGSQRLAASGSDLAIRVAHWRDALALRRDDLASLLVGEGLGSFPSAHFWRSAEPVHAASFGLAIVEGQAALRLAPGAPVYVEQLVPVRAGEPMQLTLQWRSRGAARLGVALCEKWLLTSAACAGIELAASGTGTDWQTQVVTLDDWKGGARSTWRPVKLAVFHAGGSGTLDLRALQLQRPSDATPLLRNGDWRQGLDHWFFSTDIDPPWHVHNTPVQLLLELGMFGLLAWAGAWLGALWCSARQTWHGLDTAAWPLAALSGLTVCGALNTLTDDPRLLALLLLLLALALAPAAKGPSLGMSRRGHRQRSATLTAAA